MRNIYVIGLCVVLLSLAACSNSGKRNDISINDSVVEETSVSEKTEETVYSVLGTTDIYVDANSSSKVINEKASSMTGDTEYCSIDPSCSVRVLERTGDWVKIQVVEPDWLSSSHIGWVKAEYIELTEDDAPLDIEEGKDYEIMYEDANSSVTNYYIKNISCKLDETSLYKFARALREKFGERSNIYIYESDKVKDLMLKYPLRGKEYIEVADQFAFELTFDGSSSYYPFQDIQYKQYGGKNWKKDPIK